MNWRRGLMEVPGNNTRVKWNRRSK
jgi:hypothetical protein